MIKGSEILETYFREVGKFLSSQLPTNLLLFIMLVLFSTNHRKLAYDCGSTCTAIAVLTYLHEIKITFIQ